MKKKKSLTKIYCYILPSNENPLNYIRSCTRTRLWGTKNSLLTISECLECHPNAPTMENEKKKFNFLNRSIIFLFTLFFVFVFLLSFFHFYQLLYNRKLIEELDISWWGSAGKKSETKNTPPTKKIFNFQVWTLYTALLYGVLLYSLLGCKEREKKNTIRVDAVKAQKRRGKTRIISLFDCCECSSS